MSTFQTVGADIGRLSDQFVTQAQDAYQIGKTVAKSPFYRNMLIVVLLILVCCFLCSSPLHKSFPVSLLFSEIKN